MEGAVRGERVAGDKNGRCKGLGAGEDLVQWGCPQRMGVIRHSEKGQK
jgi:hypothetical protein